MQQLLLIFFTYFNSYIVQAPTIVYTRMGRPKELASMGEKELEQDER